MEQAEYRNLNVIFTGRKVDLLHLRIHVLNAVRLENGLLVFDTDQKDLQPVTEEIPRYALDNADMSPILRIMEKVRDTKEEVLCYFEGVLQKGKVYGLPTLDSVENEKDLLGIYADPVDAVRFLYNRSTQQYYFTLKNDAQSSLFQPKIRFFYHVKKNLYSLRKDYLSGDDALLMDESGGERAALYTEDPKHLLPDDLQAKLRKELENFEPLKFIFDESLSKEIRMQKLVQFFWHGDWSQGVLNPNPSDPIKKFMAIIKQKKAVCRQKSEVFIILARMMGVPVVASYHLRSRGHMFCAIP